MEIIRIDDLAVRSGMNRRHYLAGTGSLVAAGTAGGYLTGRTHRDDVEQPDEQTDQTDNDQMDDGQVPPVRTLLHLSSGDASDQGTALRNAQNLLADSTVDNEVVRFVANSRGIFVYVDGESQHADLVRSLSESGVEFVACENSMAGLGVSGSDLLPGVGTVPSAVGDLAKRQAEGYGYIRVP